MPKEQPSVRSWSAFGRRIPGVCYPRAAAGVWGRLRREDAWDAAVFGRDDDIFAHVLTFWRSDRDVWG